MSTDQTTATEATGDAQATPAPDATSTTTDPADAQQDGTDKDDLGNDRQGRDAAKYRRQLRDVQTERDQLVAQLEAMRRAEVERLADHLVKPSAIWAAGIQLADLLTEDGTIDQDKAKQAIEQAQESLGLNTAPRPPAPDPSAGRVPQEHPSGSTLADALRPKNLRR